MMMTQTHEHKVPVLRFPEFRGEWLKKQLCKIFSIFNGYAFSSTSSQNNGALWVKIADVGIGKMKTDNLSFLPIEFLLKYKKFVLHKGDYVVALTRPILNGKLKISRICSNFNKSLLNQRVGKLVSDNDLGFVFLMLQKSRIVSYIENSIAGTDPPNLAPSSIRSVKVYVPDVVEQQKIASFLTSVDTKIEQLAKKKALLEQYKKGMMQKLFSQEFRFKDEKGNNFPEWKKKRLGEVAEFKRGKGISKIDISEDGVNKCIRYGELYTEYNEVITAVVSRTDTSKDKSVLSEENDILMPTSDVTPNGLATASALDDFGVILGSDILIIRSKQIRNAYFCYYIATNKKDIMRLVSGVTVYHIYGSDMATLRINIPSLPEQQKIANFLSSIDKKIDLVATELNLAQTFKKGLLQQMFI